MFNALLALPLDHVIQLADYLAISRSQCFLEVASCLDYAHLLLVLWMVHIEMLLVESQHGEAFQSVDILDEICILSPCVPGVQIYIIENTLLLRVFALIRCHHFL